MNGKKIKDKATKETMKSSLNQNLIHIIYIKVYSAIEASFSFSSYF